MKRRSVRTLLMRSSLEAVHELYVRMSGERKEVGVLQRRRGEGGMGGGFVFGPMALDLLHLMMAIAAERVGLVDQMSSTGGKGPSIQTKSFVV
jgi:hypothetical protein